jgi:predicted lipoprotein
LGDWSDLIGSMRAIDATRVVLAAVLVVQIGGCKIIRDGDQSAETHTAVFDAKAYVSGIWDQKVLPLFKEKTVDVNALLSAITKDPNAAGMEYGHRAGDGQPWTFLIEGKGVVRAFDVKSRHGTVTLDVGSSPNPIEVTLQVGPVVFGTAMRDALPFISFGDFVNQIDYAEVSRALNDRAVAGLSTAPGLSVGAQIEFKGAATAPASNAPLLVTPLEITVGQKQ